MLQMSRLAGLWLVVLLLTGFAPPAQDPLTPVVSLSVDAGYNGLFRENYWIPLHIRISNDGDPTSGQLIVRPETSGNAFPNTFSLPVDLPAGTRQSLFLYITARSFASQVRVELTDADNQVITSQEAPMRGVSIQDQIHVVLTQSSAGSVDFSTVHAGGFNAHQANWLIEDLPDQMMGLQAIDTLVFSDIDSGTLTLSQRSALADWVTQGGHLIVTGGANWQGTASGLEDLLPLMPSGSDTVTNFSEIVALANLSETLDGETVAATGDLSEDAVVLANADDLPLTARRSYGLGTVDYLAIDPVTQPLRGWAGLNNLWFTLAASVNPVPGWSNGFKDFDRATSAAEILPGFDLLPNVLPLCGFLAVYVALIGPLNYLVLNRINRREFAWLTIPFFIIVFSALAWLVGFNLRGNSVTLSRLAVVQSWPDNEQATVNGLVGLLSPRRTTYTLTMDDGSFLRPIARNIQANPFASSVQASTDIRQEGDFRADNFLVDASFIATFSSTGITEKPAINGQASLFYDTDNQSWAVRGSVRNDSDITLTDAVILTRGLPLRLEAPLAPGDVQTFDVLLDTIPQPAAPSPLERTSGFALPRFGLQRFSQELRASEQTISDILGEEQYDARTYTTALDNSTEEQERRRRQFFLSAFNVDHYFSNSRGDQVFLAGWSDTIPLETNLGDVPWEAVDTTLHIIELNVDITPPTGRVRIGVDQFTWVTQERGGVTDSLAPVNTVLQPGDEAVIRFTPLPHAVLDDVESLRLVVDNPGNIRNTILLEVWDWEAEGWETLELIPLEENSSTAVLVINDAARYLGTQNSVQIRLAADESISFVRYLRVGVEQVGRF